MQAHHNNASRQFITKLTVNQDSFLDVIDSSACFSSNATLHWKKRFVMVTVEGKTLHRYLRSRNTPSVSSTHK